MIIDVHAHAFPAKIARRALDVLEEKAAHAIEPVGDGTLECLVRQAKAAGVDKAAFVPIATKPAQFEGILAEAIAIRDGERGAEAAKRIIPLASVHPADPEWRVRLKEIAERKIKGIKVHPYYQECVLDSPRMLEYFHCCRDLGLAVVCHCGFDIGFPERAPICGPERVARVMREVPGLKFIAAHLGGWGQWGGAVENLLGKDVMLDTSMMTHLFGDPNALKMLHEHPAERLLFATDWPWLKFEDGLRFMRDAHFAPADEAAILGGNAARLFGLAEKQGEAEMKKGEGGSSGVLLLALIALAAIVAALAYFGASRYVVATGKGRVIVPKRCLTYTDTFTDIRGWKYEDRAAHKDLCDAMEKGGAGDLLPQPPTLSERASDAADAIRKEAGKLKAAAGEAWDDAKAKFREMTKPADGGKPVEGGGQAL